MQTTYQVYTHDLHLNPENRQVDALEIEQMIYNGPLERQTGEILIHLSQHLQPHIMVDSACLAILVSPIQRYPIEVILPCDYPIKRSLVLCTSFSSDNYASQDTLKFNVMLKAGAIATSEMLECTHTWIAFDGKCIKFIDVPQIWNANKGQNVLNISILTGKRDSDVYNELKIAHFPFHSKTSKQYLDYRLSSVKYLTPLNSLLRSYMNHERLEYVVFHDTNENAAVVLTTFHSLSGWNIMPSCVHYKQNPVHVIT